MLNSLPNQRFIAGFDGLRALAILFIIAYHFSFSWAGGGFLGVDAFFVLSGYLMTSKIISMHGNEADMSLQKLWSGRVQRLLPTVYIMIAVTLLWVALLKKELLSTILKDAAASLFYGTNWWFVFHKLSYFDSFGAPSPFKHLWYLAVQEQFFFVWSIVLIVGLRCFKKRWTLSIITFILITCSSLLMGIMYNPEADPSRVYYGTDTRSFELLIGSWLALTLPMHKFSSVEITDIKMHALNIASIFSLAAFILGAIFMDEFQAFLYFGGMLLVSLNAALLIVCISHPSCFTGKILSWKPLQWIGTRSFGLYLWHYPIIVLSTPIYEIGNPAYWRVLLQVVITCIIAELTYRYVETPIRILGLREYCRKYLSLNIFKWRQLTYAKRALALITAILVVVLAIDMIDLASGENTAEKTEARSVESVDKRIDKTSLKTNYRIKPSSRGMLSLVEDYMPYTDNSNDLNSTSMNNIYNEILAIGDSIMLDIASNLKEKYDNITIDGKVSRQISDAIKLAPEYTEFNSSDKIVIIELGTNGYITDRQIDSLLDFFSKAQVYLVNTRVPRSWERKVNKVLLEKAEERENVTLIDWYSTAIKHPEYIGRDGVHLKSSGSEALTNLIYEALN